MLDPICCLRPGDYYSARVQQYRFDAVVNLKGQRRALEVLLTASVKEPNKTRRDQLKKTEAGSTLYISAAF